MLLTASVNLLYSLIANNARPSWINSASPTDRLDPACLEVKNESVRSIYEPFINASCNHRHRSSLWRPLTRGFVIRRHRRSSDLIVGSSFLSRDRFPAVQLLSSESGYSVNEGMKRGFVSSASEWVSMYLHPARMLCQPANWFRLSGSVERVGFARSCVGLLSFGLSLHPLICSHSANRW